MTAVVLRGMDHRHAAAINRICGAPPPGRSLPCPGGSVRTGHWSLRATKYRQAGKAPVSRQGDSGNRRVLLSFIPAGTHRQIPSGCVPAPPRTLFGWSPPQPRFQETAPDAGSRVEPHWVRGATSGRDHRAASGEGGGQVPDVGVGSSGRWSVGKGRVPPAACSGGAAVGNLRNQNGR